MRTLPSDTHVVPSIDLNDGALSRVVPSDGALFPALFPALFKALFPALFPALFTALLPALFFYFALL